MKLTTLALVGFMGIVVSGCRNQTRIMYDEESGKMVPVLHSKELVTFNVPVDWSPTGMPCDPNRFKESDQKECLVIETANKHNYAYTCHGGGCDPEIAVDDDKNMRVTTLRAGTRTVTPVFVNLGCSTGDAGGQTIVDPPDMNVAAVGDTIGWRTLGDHELTNFKVTLEGDYKDKLCYGGAYEFKKGDRCKLLKLDGTTYVPYSVTSDNCQKAAGRVTPQ